MVALINHREPSPARRQQLAPCRFDRRCGRNGPPGEQCVREGGRVRRASRHVITIQGASEQPILSQEDHVDVLVEEHRVHL